MATIIFDLDGTVIDTRHRYRDLPCGKIDLDFWFANSTPDMIAQDRLLPLANAMRTMYAAGHAIVVCTARDFSPLNGVDLGAVYRQFLDDNGLQYHALLHRTMAGPDHETMGDGALKIRLLTDYAEGLGYANIKELGAIMFDDNLTVIEALRDHVIMINASRENERLAA